MRSALCSGAHPHTHTSNNKYKRIQNCQLNIEHIYLPCILKIFDDSKEKNELSAVRSLQKTTSRQLRTILCRKRTFNPELLTKV